MTEEQTQDWAAETAGRIESAVGTVRDKVVLPVVTVARAVVFGILVAAMGVVIAVVLAIALVRMLDVYVPGDVWAAHLIVGGLFSLAGLLLWRKRRPRQAEGAA